MTQFGFHGVLYYADEADTLTGRPYDEPEASKHGLTAGIWNELELVKDVNLSGSATKVNTTTRATAKQGWKTEVPTTRDASLASGANWDDADPVFQRLIEAWRTNTPISLLDLTGPITENTRQGLGGNFYVEFGQEKPVEGVQAVSLTFSLAGLCDWYVVDAGVLKVVGTDGNLYVRP